MNDGKLDDATIRQLRLLDAVESIAANGDNVHIRYAEWFKRDAARRYRQGERPSHIFRSVGLEPTVIGHKRVERCIARWRKLYGDDDKETVATLKAEHVGRKPLSEPDYTTLNALAVMEGEALKLYSQIRQLRLETEDELG